MAILFLILGCFAEVESMLSHPDKITKLPGQPTLQFQQFAGYVTVDDRKQRALFYYFVEAEKDPSSKPLVLWLNGGMLISLASLDLWASLLSFTEHN